MRLEPDQEAMLRAALSVWSARSRAFAELREALLARSAAGSGDLGLQEAVLKELQAAQAAFEVHTIVFTLCVYGSLLTAVQVTTLLVSSWPWVPSLHGMHAVICSRAEQQKAQAAAPRPHEQPPEPPQPQQRPRARPRQRRGCQRTEGGDAS
ncbi:MAG: hypothetical protein J3K34DRAFT_413644 [Monoraphidium minutum]|nr:MAG: hypothetical protein J3K34DRAFT_413644 [Monoraphidium minutum]